MVIRLTLLIWLLTAALARAEVDARLMILHDHGNPVVAEMILLTVRGEYDLTVSLEDMQFPDSPDYDWIQIARDDWRKERVNGRLLQIFERRIAVFARHDGPLTVGPVTHHLTYVTEDGLRDTADVTAPPVQIGVKPFPGDYRPLGARQLTLTDELSADPGRLKKDEVLTRRVTIEALGALSHHLPPRPDLRQPWMISFTQPELRETVPTPDGPVSRVVWEWQLRPHTGEPAILPAFAFPWFDTNNRRIEIAAMKPIPFGFVGFGTNFGTTSERRVYSRLLAGTLLAAGMIAALAIMLRGQGLAGQARIGQRLRRVRPGPHLPALRSAARLGDLPRLRAAAMAHLAWRGDPVPPVMSVLDQQLFAAVPPDGFNAERWLQDFRDTLRRT